jgi:dihydrofolate reductase
MRQLINSTYITLDGVVDAPQLWVPLEGPAASEKDEIQIDLLASCDIVLMGRLTYEGFAPAWSNRGGDPLSDRMNSIRKLVVSTTLEEPKWNNTEVIATDVADHVRQLKNEDGGHIVQYGFGDVSRLLLEHDLFDQLRLWIYPLLGGQSDVGDLLSHRATATTFNLVDTKVLSNGIIVATYTP